MAEAAFQHVVKEKGLESQFKIDSCGTAGYHVGEAPDSRTVAVCRQNGVPINHSARQLKQPDFDEFDYILCMDESNIRNAESIRPRGSKAKLQLFGDYDPEGERIIKDPYYGGQDGFEKNFAQAIDTETCGTFPFATGDDDVDEGPDPPRSPDPAIKEAEGDTEEDTTAATFALMLATEFTVVDRPVTDGGLLRGTPFGGNGKGG
ncbi:hypothetical protein HDU97_003154 [Phlyctochytrium planicorne]|nr:hypothetical protein HDU97_003154 [Phlyctochytrium planicorne]